MAYERVTKRQAESVLINKRHETNRCGWVKVVGYENSYRVHVLFEDTGNVLVKTAQNILSGSVEDPDHPNAHLGNSRASQVLQDPEYKAWLRDTFDYRAGWLWYKEAGARMSVFVSTNPVTGKQYYYYRSHGTTIGLHRLIFLHQHGYVTKGLEIDHKDGNGLNNDISNLREGTSRDNSENRVSANVHWNEQKLIWLARVMKSGKPYQKAFSTKPLTKQGMDFEKAKAEAKKQAEGYAYELRAKLHSSEFANHEGSPLWTTQ